MNEALGRYFDVKYYGRGYPGFGGERRIDVLKVIEKLYPGDYPDVVLQTSPHNNTGVFYDMDNFERAKCLRAMWLIDFHNDVGRNEVYEYIKAGNVDLILKNYDVRNETEWGKKLVEAGVPIEWHPFSIDPEIFYDMKIPNLYDVINLGQMTTQNYPIRLRIDQILRKQEKIKYYKRTWDYKKLYDEDTTIKEYKHNKPVWGTEYAKLINQTRIFATDCSTFRFAVQKIFETMACKTLLMCNAPLSAKELGFVPGVNFVDFDHHPRQLSEVRDEKIITPIKYYLSHPEEAAKIAKRGYELVHSRHTHEIRIKELEVIFKKYL